MARAKIISDGQMAEIMACMRETSVPIELVVLYLILRDTGLRISEVIPMKFGIFWRDEKIARELHIPGAMRKGGKKAVPVTVVLSSLLRETLHLYARRMAEQDMFGGDKFLFPGRSDNAIGHVHRATAARRLKGLFIRALGETAAAGMTTHSPRRTFATALYRLGVPAEIIQLILGHKQLETTLRYIEFSKNQITQPQGRLHAHRAQFQKAHRVSGPWRAREGRLIQSTFLSDEAGYIPETVSCTNEEADRALLETVSARLRSTRCKPERPRRRPRHVFGGSSE